MHFDNFVILTVMILDKEIPFNLKRAYTKNKSVLYALISWTTDPETFAHWICIMQGGNPFK
jgi:hypothetical protein